MATERIRIDISTDGTIKAETIGILGQKCLDYIAVLEDLLDANAIHSSFTKDYNSHEVTVTGEQGVDNAS